MKAIKRKKTSPELEDLPWRPGWVRESVEMSQVVRLRISLKTEGSFDEEMYKFNLMSLRKILNWTNLLSMKCYSQGFSPQKWSQFIRFIWRRIRDSSMLNSKANRSEIVSGCLRMKSIKLTLKPRLNWTDLSRSMRRDSQEVSRDLLTMMPVVWRWIEFWIPQNFSLFFILKKVLKWLGLGNSLFLSYWDS